MDYKEFLMWEQFSRDTIDVKRVYIDVSEDLIAGILLSQIVYWNLPNQEGKTKLRVTKNNELWLAKGRNDWWEECRISPKQYDRAIKILEKKDLIKKKIFKFKGSPTSHIKLNLDVLTKDLSVFTQRVITKLPKGKKPFYPKGNNEITQRVNSITKNTTKIINTEKTTTRQFTENDKKLKLEIDNTINAKITKKAFTKLLQHSNLDTIRYYLQHWDKFIATTTINNVTGFFLEAVINEYAIPQQTQTQTNKPIQSTNYEQREYDDDYYDSLYDNLF